MPRSKLTRLPLGTRVRFTRSLVRREDGMHDNHHVERWTYPIFTRETVSEGIVVGYRTKRHGYTDWHGEGGNEFVTVGTRIVVLVAVNLDHAPKFVDPADIEVLP